MNTFSSWPNRAACWQLSRSVLRFESRPSLMGIVNVTPDSFSDGGKFFDIGRAVDHGLELAEEGADLLDVGGESTRPYATPVEVEEERQRVVPVIEQLARQTDTPISIDTSKAIVAQQALDAGAQVINDITGLQGDPDMLPMAVRYQPGVCAMHMQGTPQTMQDKPTYENVVREVGDYLRERRDQLLQAGISCDRICLDPGIGFGKTHEHNLQLLANCGCYHQLGQTLLVGHSRKGFIAKALGDKQADRTAGTLGVSIALSLQGIQVLRVHDVKPTRDALLLFELSRTDGDQSLSKPHGKAR